MTEYKFKIHKDVLARDGILKEASAEELRVLLALISQDGSATKEMLCHLCGCSSARVASSVALFCESGVLTPVTEVRITEEFDSPTNQDDVYEQSAAQVAKTVRDKELAELLDDFTRLAKKTTLKDFEVAKITALVSQYELSAEFIALYMSHLAERGQLTSANALVRGAIRLFDTGIRDTESLCRHLTELESSSAIVSEIKKSLGIYRRLSPSEEAYIGKWTDGFGYSVPVVTLAYDITVLNTGKVSFKYMDKLLCDWHAAGCRTESECESRYNEKSKELAKATTPAKRDTKPKLKYGDFDPEEALQNAIRNSGFFDDDDDFDDDGDDQG